MVNRRTRMLLPTNKALRHFGFRQTLKGALTVGFLAGIMMGAQGAAYAAAYPDQHSRDILVASLQSAAALGFLAGEIENASTPASYSIYKSIALVTLLTAVWGLLATTKLLRGQEEDGRLEQIVSGKTTKAKASLHILIGFGYSILLAFVIAWIFIAALGVMPKVDLAVSNSTLLTIGVFLPCLFFAGLGVLTSQLAVTRGRALAYGLSALLTLFVLRGSANSVADWNWLKQWSPFGWTDLLNPVLDPQVGWIIPTALFFIIVVPLGLLLAKNRDLGASILPESDHARSRYFLLRSAFAFSIRRSLGTFFWWMVATLSYIAVLSSIAKIGADALSSSPAFTQIIKSLGGNYDDLVIAFLGFGGMFTALILLVMVAVYMGNTRQEEAKGYLDNILVQPVRRSVWLAQRTLIATSMAFVIALLSAYLIWQIATLQNIVLDLAIVLQNAVALTGTIVLFIGIGALTYGLLPRFTAIIMYALIIWAFVVDVLKSLYTLNDWIDKTSLLHYVSFAPTKTPDWTQFAWLLGIGVVLTCVGIWFFTRRDIVSE